MSYFSITCYYNFHNLFVLSPYVYSISHRHFNVPSISLAGDWGPYLLIWLAAEGIMLLAGVSDVDVVETLLRLVWPLDYWLLLLIHQCYCQRKLFVYQQQLKVSGGLRAWKLRWCFPQSPQRRGKTGEWLQDPAGQHLYLTTGVCCWLWDLLCGSRSARERWDPHNKAGWEHLFQQTEQNGEESLKLWTSGEGYNETKSNEEVQDWVGERRVQYGRHKSKEALASKMCTQKHVAWQMNSMNWSSKSSHRATSLSE